MNKYLLFYIRTRKFGLYLIPFFSIDLDLKMFIITSSTFFLNVLIKTVLYKYLPAPLFLRLQEILNNARRLNF